MRCVSLLALQLFWANIIDHLRSSQFAESVGDDILMESDGGKSPGDGVDGLLWW